MWKNVFIETCILSALIFGGFYINASILKKEIFDTHKNLLNEQRAHSEINRLHFSGNFFSTETSAIAENRISGNAFKTDHRSSLSGTKIPPDFTQSSKVSGNRA